MSLLLSLEERQRFAAWLDHEATSNDGVIQQMEKFSDVPAMQQIAKRLRAESAAARVISAKLRSIEDVAVSREGTPQPPVHPREGAEE